MTLDVLFFFCVGAERWPQGEKIIGADEGENWMEGIGLSFVLYERYERYER